MKSVTAGKFDMVEGRFEAKSTVSASAAAAAMTWVKFAFI